MVNSSAQRRSGCRSITVLLAMTRTPDAETVHEAARPVDVASTIGPLRHGPRDPCHTVDADGSIWRASGMPSGPVTYRLSQVSQRAVRCQAWGPGSAELVAGIGELLGGHDDCTSFVPDHPKVFEAHRRHQGLRIPRSARVLESLVPAILEQKVTGKEAFGSWRILVTKYGVAAPGPAPAAMRIPPTAERWRLVPSWEFHRAGVDPRRARTVVTCARVADQLERCTELSHSDARRRLMSVPGVGEWTAAEVAQRALGDADALSVGDYHLSGIIGWSMLGRPMDDAEMVEYLEPLRPHRHRVVRLLQVSGQAVKPRFGPRLTIQDHRRH